MAVVYLSLGSNLGDRLSNLKAAVSALRRSPAVTVLAESPIYETPPWGVTDQPPFLNMALQGETVLAPVALLSYLKSLETRLGRRPSFRYGPRKIDVDILFYDNIILDAPDLTLPHPRLHERAFVLVPLADLAPDLIHPRLGQSIRDLVSRVNRNGIRRYEG